MENQGFIMIKSLQVTNFTLFADAELHFGRGLNLFIGENGTGKSHILKLAYSLVAALTEIKRDRDVPTKAFLQEAIALKLKKVFRPDELGRLTRRKPGRSRAEIVCKFADPSLNLSFSFATSSRTEVNIEKLPSKWLEKLPVFIPTRELMSIYPNFVSIYDTTQGLEIDATWRDTCLLLGALEKRGPKENAIRDLLQPLEKAMGGSIELDKGGRFYLKPPPPVGGKVEMHLVAEGIRKLAMIARLISTGSLLEKGYLFWDEPEANLNPKVIKQVACTILHLVQNGIQVFVATHSLFLMREIHILQMKSEERLDARFFGLHADSESVQITSGKTLDDIGDITSLDEELQQSERYLEVENSQG